MEGGWELETSFVEDVEGSPYGIQMESWARRVSFSSLLGSLAETCPPQLLTV